MKIFEMDLVGTLSPSRYMGSWTTKLLFAGNISVIVGTLGKSCELFYEKENVYNASIRYTKANTKYAIFVSTIEGSCLLLYVTSTLQLDTTKTTVW